MRYDMKKRDPFYATAAWQRLRGAALLRDHYLCCRCRKRPANTVHHIKPREEFPELALDLDNLESLCPRCHNQAHPEKGSIRIRISELEPLPEDLEDIRVIVIK